MPLYLGNTLISGQSRPIDKVVTQGSENLIASGAVKTYVDGVASNLVTEITPESIGAATVAQVQTAQSSAENAAQAAQSAQSSADSKVPNTRKINNKQLNVDITLTASDVGAATTEEVQATAATKAPMYDYGTADLTAGSSSLETGKLYFVYE